MFPLDPQVIHNYIHSVALLAIAVVLGVVVQLVRKLRRERPSESLVMELRRETERFAGMVADLEERFSRFQKREGMRHARETKESSKDLLSQAAELVRSGSAPIHGSGTSGQAPNKVELYRRARGLNS